MNPTPVTARTEIMKTKMAWLPALIAAGKKNTTKSVATKTARPINIKLDPASLFSAKPSIFTSGRSIPVKEALWLVRKHFSVT
jgi:hypothetical protein